MKFRLKTAGEAYSDNHPQDAEKVERLKKLGFQFERSTTTFSDRERLWIEGSPEIEIPDLDALMAFVREWGMVVVDIDDGENELEIYDDYRE